MVTPPDRSESKNAIAFCDHGRLPNARISPWHRSSVVWDLHRRRSLVLTNARSCNGRIVEGPDVLQGLKPVARERPITFKPVQRRFADMRDQFDNRAALIFGGRRTNTCLPCP